MRTRWTLVATCVVLLAMLRGSDSLAAKRGGGKKNGNNSNSDSSSSSSSGSSTAETSSTQGSHANDPIAQALDKAKSDYTDAIAAAKSKWLDVIDTRIKAAEDRGDLKTAESLQKAREQVQKDATLPDDVKDASVVGAGKIYEGQVKMADAKLNSAYQKAIADYTKSHQLELAEAVQQEMNGGGSESDSASASGGNVDYHHLGGTRGVPPFLKIGDGAEGTRDGLVFSKRDAWARTKDGDFLNRDFTFDVLVQLGEKEDNDKEVTIIGLGEGSYDGGYAEPQRSVCMRIHPPDRDSGAVVVSKNSLDKPFDHVRNPGLHMLRIQKVGNAVTFAIDVDYRSGAFKPTISRTIPDIRQYAPFLNDRNTFLFFGRGGTFKEVGLIKKPPQPQPGSS